MTYYITQDTTTNLFSLTLCKPDPVLGEKSQTIVGEFFDISLNELTKIINHHAS